MQVWITLLARFVALLYYASAPVNAEWSHVLWLFWQTTNILSKVKSKQGFVGNQSEVTLEKIMTGAGIEPATSDYIHWCSKPLSYWVNKIVAIYIQHTPLCHYLSHLDLPSYGQHTQEHGCCYHVGNQSKVTLEKIMTGAGIEPATSDYTVRDKTIQMFIEVGLFLE